MPKPKPYFKPFGQLEPKPSLCQPPRPDLDSMATFTVGGVNFECDVRDIEEKKFLGKGAYGHVVEVGSPLKFLSLLELQIVRMSSYIHELAW